MSIDIHMFKLFLAFMKFIVRHVFKKGGHWILSRSNLISHSITPRFILISYFYLHLCLSFHEVFWHIYIYFPFDPMWPVISSSMIATNIVYEMQSCYVARQVYNVRQKSFQCANVLHWSLYCRLQLLQHVQHGTSRNQQGESYQKVPKHREKLIIFYFHAQHMMKVHKHCFQLSDSLC